MSHVIASRKEAGYWSTDGWCFDLASALIFDASVTDGFLDANPDAQLWPLEKAQGFGDFDPLIENLYQLEAGDEVVWTDPDEGLGSGAYYVIKIASDNGFVEGNHGNTVATLRNDAGTVVEAFVSELDRGA